MLGLSSVSVQADGSNKLSTESLKLSPSVTGLTERELPNLNGDPFLLKIEVVLGNSDSLTWLQGGIRVHIGHLPCW